MKKIVLLSALFAFALSANAQKSKIIGSWLMTKAEIKGKTEHPYQIFDFQKNGKLVAMGMELAEWKYDKKKNAITMNSKMAKDFNGALAILKLDKKKLTLQKDGDKFYYSRLKPEKIARNNKKSNLAGNWEIDSDQYRSSLLKFELPNAFTLIESGDGMTSTTRGTWIYQPKKETLLMIGFFQQHPLRGKNKVKKISKKILVMKNGDHTIKAKRLKKNKQAIERLTFNEDDFPEEQPENGPELPWMDFYEMVDFLNTVQWLEYTYGQLEPETKTLKHTYSIASKLTVKPNKPSVRFTNFTVTANGEEQFSEKYRDELAGSYDLFFPQKELWPYRIIGAESLTVPAGTFNCTVVEGFDGDTKAKYWLINDMPGIYAKVIKDGQDPFDKPQYSVMELKKITYKAHK